MATSRCEQPPEGRLRVPPDATPAEAAAIAAAIGAHLRDRRVVALTADVGSTDRGWDGRRWQFAGRTEALSGTARRVPTDAPTDDWTAAGRLENR